MIVKENNFEKLKVEYELLIKKSIEKVINMDYSLLVNNSHEITISNKLSQYMDNYFDTFILSKNKDLTIDIEYNRMVVQEDSAILEEVSKAIYMASFEKNKLDLHNVIKRNIRPDIIIHKRGTNTDNILWLELKINVPEEKCRFDKQKSWYAISQLNYKFGTSILIDYRKKELYYFGLT